MKTILPIIFSMLMTMPLCFAGNSSGGGGQGIVCRNDDGSVKSAQLLDLAEAEYFFLLNIPKDQANEKSYLEIAHHYSSILDNAIPSSFPTAQRKTMSDNAPVLVEYDINISILGYKYHNYSSIRLYVDYINQHMKLISGDNFKIPAVNDSNPRLIPAAKNCQLEQVAFYKDGSNQVYIVENVWSKLSKIDKAALLIHEALYRQLRVMGEVDSDRTRKTVAYLFGGLEFSWVLKNLPETYLFCWTDDLEASFQFAVYPKDDDSVIALFLVYNGEVMLTQTSTELGLDPFAAQFGKSIGSQEAIISSRGIENTIIRTIQNPLIEMPNYSFSIHYGHNGEITSFIEAFSTIAGKNMKKVSCQKIVSTVIYEADGSIRIHN